MACLDAETVLGFVEGKLDADALATTDAHLAVCGDCREVVAVLARGSTSNPAPSTSAGEPVGRYILLETIGRGSMGVVHAAWDPDLDRRIAIKLLRAGLAPHASAQARERLLREGRAIAQLAHPNVVAVHDVGDFERGIFVAMEYVDGGALAAWCDKLRDRDTVVAAYEQAARGLAAAHAAGLVHRDVKPSNLLVGSDGRVRVADFGLARAEPGDGEPAALSVTATGQLLGTPLYMAPETMSGEPADARADQYALAASLYETLGGAKPFAGRTLAELEQAKRHASLAPPVRRIPPAVLAAIRRALDPDPRARWPSIDRLADRLSRHLHRRRRWMLAGSAVAAAAGIALSIVVARPEHVDPCGGGAERLGSAWAPARATAVRTMVGERVAATLDRYADTWVADYRRVCEATRVHGAQSEVLLDVRMRCLDARRNALAALVDVLTVRTDATTRTSAVAAALALAPVTECDAVDALAAIAPPPLHLQDQVAAASRLVDEAEALDRTGQLADGLAKVKTVPELGYPALAARAGLVRGRLEEELGDTKAAEATLHAAAQAAAEAHDDVTAANAWTLLVGVVGYLDNRPTDGLALAQVADAAVARANAADTAGAELASMRGLVFDTLGKFDEARAFHERALAIRERTLGPDHLEVAQVLDNLGAIPLQQERFAEAEHYYARALAIRRRVLGDEHPDVAASWNALGAAQRGLGRLADARASYEAALAIWRRTLGNDHPNIASVLVNLGNLARDAKQPAEAERFLEEAAAAWRRLDPQAHAADLGTTVGSLGNLAFDRGDLTLAESRLREAIGLLEGALGPNHPRLADQLDNLAVVRQARGDRADAERLHARAKALRASR